MAKGKKNKIGRNQKISKAGGQSNSQANKKVKQQKLTPQVLPSFWEQPGLLFGIVAFSIVLYFMTFNYGFILDDVIVYSKNDFVKKGLAGIPDLLTTEGMIGYFGEQKDVITGARYRPLSMITFAIEHQFAGLNPSLSHVVNALLYGICGLFVYYLARLFWPAADRNKWYAHIGFWAAILFIAHPIHTEAVANIKGRDEIMAVLFSLWALTAAFKARRLLDYAIVGLLYYLALLSKENSLTFLAVIPASLYVFRKNPIEKKEWGRLFGVLLLVTIVYIAQRTAVIGYLLSAGNEITELMNNPFVDMSVGEKYATIFYTLIKYIGLMLWPNPLSHDYYPYAIATRNWSDIWSILSILMYTAGGLFAAWKIWKRNVYAYFILFFIATLSIVSNIPFTVGTTMNERFIFMPSVAFAWFVAYLFIDVLPNRIQSLKRIGFVVPLMLSLVYAGLTIQRIPVWKDKLTLNRAAVSVYPNSARSNLFLGTALYNEALNMTDAAEQEATYAESMSYLERSLEIHPSYGNALKMKAGVAAKLYEKDRDLNKLLNTFTDVLLARPGTAYVHEYLIYLNRRPQLVDQLTRYYYRLGFETFGQQQGDWRWAEKFLRYGYELDPSDTSLANALIQTYENLRLPDRANQIRARMRQ